MNVEEATKICWYVKRARPHITLDQQTPAVWADQLSGIRYEDAQDAVRALLAEQHYVDPSDIRRHVRRIRNERLRVHPPVNPPPGLTFQQEQEWRRGINRRIGDGELIDVDAEYAALEMKPRDMRAITGPMEEQR